jgi:hypothetical protein
MCAKHIVAAGIAKVVFLEPYPKRLAFDLHADSIQVEGGDRGHYHEFPTVAFEHFFGVSPRRYRELFERGRRKDGLSGAFIEYRDGTPTPILEIKFPFYAELEGYFTKKAMRAVNTIKRAQRASRRKTKRTKVNAIK